MGQCGPHAHFSSVFLMGGLFIIVSGIAANLGGVLSSAFLVFSKMGVGASPLWGDWARCSLNKKVITGWYGIWPWGVLSVLWGCGSGYSFRLLLYKGIVTVGGGGAFFLPGLSCWIGDILEFTLSQVVYSHSYGFGDCGCMFCQLHLGQCCHSDNHCWSRINGQGGVCGQRKVGRHGLCNYSHLEPSLHSHFGSLLLFSPLGY